MKKLPAVALAVFLCVTSFSQEKVENVEEYLYNSVYKNIAAYNIRYADFWVNDVDFQNTFKTTGGFFYDHFMADHGYKLKMTIEKIDAIYPNPRFRLYKIHLNGFDFTPEKHGLPEISFNHGKTTHDFLVAFNEINGDIKFISGQFFSSYISSDFKVDIKKPLSLIPYLSLRSFSVGGRDIHFKKRKRKKLWYEGYSDIYFQPFQIWVDMKDPDHMQSVVLIKRKQP